MLPKRWRLDLSDGFSFGFLIVALLSVYLFEIFIVLPRVDGGLLSVEFHALFGSFIFSNILGNLAMMMWTDSSTRKIILPSQLKPGWYFCSACEANSPPRTFHCPKCNVCILKRDHHCTFAMCCIGLKNIRYFVMFLFYLSFGSLYATVFNMYFIWDVLGGFSLFSLSAHLLPFIFVMLGYLNIEVFAYTTLSMLSIIGVLFVSHLFVFHVQQVIKNQTTFEKMQGVTNYDLGWKANLAESFGQKWYIAWIFPFVDSPLPSDGLSFNSRDISNLKFGSYEVSQVRQRHI
ncbi:probable palmitoyltransferase ZDHHC24 [Uloborus diversus]|uniref:probable palmitoyltransferase ZDHHC24 n=1 Tax=Uloborus diversus TaxID=327109 RepID=UPI002409FC60|nr:probable palmitoyltransferase ZDHHC24 [Uloborus diversus]